MVTSALMMVIFNFDGIMGLEENNMSSLRPRICTLSLIRVWIVTDISCKVVHLFLLLRQKLLQQKINRNSTQQFFIIVIFIKLVI